MKNKKKCAICTMCMSAIIISLLCIMPISAAYSDEFSFQIGNTNSAGELSSERFWERGNKAQCYYYPSIIPYYDSLNPDGIAHREGYGQLFIPEYINPIYALNDIDNDDYGALAAISPAYSYTVNGDTDVNFVGGIQLDALGKNGKSYQGTLKYTISPNLANGFYQGAREMWIGDIYSYYETHLYNGLTNDVEINGLTITNQSNGTVVVYLLGDMYYASATTDEKPITGVVHIDNYVILNPSYSVTVDRTLVEGETNGVEPLLTRWSGAIMVRYGNDCDRPVQYTEYFNDYFSYCYSYSDTNLNGLGYGADGRNGGHSIVNTWAMQMYMEQTLEPIPPINPTGNIDITSNGIYNVREYATATVNVPQTLEWGGLFDWLFDSIGAFMDFEVAPNWSIGTIMTIVVGLAVAIWVLKVFLGG